MQQTLVLYECISGKRERDSENFGVRIVRNGVMVGKIWTFEVLGAKWSFQVVLGGIFGTCRVYGGPWCERTGAYAEIWQFIGA
jgi:hypothetical protein